MPLQFRPIDTSKVDRKFYCPSRDLAYIGPALGRGAVAALEEQYWEPWFAEYMRKHGYKYEDLVEPVRRLAVALTSIIQTRDPKEALDASGFSELAPELQLAIYGRLGQILLAAIWTGVKDISKPSDDPPASLTAMLQDVSDALNRMYSS